MFTWAPAAIGVVAGSLLVGAVMPAVVDQDPQAIRAAATEAAERQGSAASGGATNPDEASGDAIGAPATNGTGSTSQPGRPGRPGSGASSPSASSEASSGEPIRVGFLLLDVATAGRLGINVAIDPEQQEAAYRAFVAEVNETGGINGRPVDPRFAVYDVSSQDSMRAACLKLTEEDKVFAVIGAFNYVAPIFCIVDEHRTLLFSNQGTNPDELFERAQGRLFTIFPRDTRLVGMWAAELARLQAIQGKVVGIVNHDGADPTGRTGDVLEQHVLRQGAKKVVEERLEGDVTQAASQVPVAVNRMRSQGVEIVLFMVGMTVPGASFVQQAERQNWRPAYSASDLQANFGDTNTQAMPESFDGAISVTTTRNSEFRGNKPEPAEAQRCKQVYERRSGRTLAARGSNEYSLTVNACDNFGIFTDAARAAGARLDHDTVRASVEGLGQRSLGIWSGGSYGPGKHDLNDFVRIQRWRAGCRCWMPDGDFHRPGG